VVALGFNGFPVNVEDSVDRLQDAEQKNEMVVHAEENAVLIAGLSTDGGKIYVFGKPICSRRAGEIDPDQHADEIEGAPIGPTE
jgi:dCMP deaminase